MERMRIELELSDTDYASLRAWAGRRIMTEGKKRKSDGFEWFDTAAQRREAAARRLAEQIDYAGRGATVDYCG
jgi:hypothetical protein